MARFTQKLLIMLAPAELMLLQYLADKLHTSKLQVVRDALRFYAKKHNPQVAIEAFEEYLKQRLAELPAAQQTPQVADFARDLCDYLYDRAGGNVVAIRTMPGATPRSLPSVASIIGRV